MATGPLALSFVRSYVDIDALPFVNAEVALVGRSNVGKSSLLNALAQRKNLAKTSKTPGATRLMNAFELAPENSGRWVMDLPGYGFAKVSKAEQQKWATMLSEYIEERENLVSVVLLIDGAVGPTSLDLQTVEWLHSLDRPITYVATKADKVKATDLAAVTQATADEARKHPAAHPEIIATSSELGMGIPKLRAAVLDAIV